MDPFASLGLPYRFDIDRKSIEARYRELQRELHPDRHTSQLPAARRMALSKAMEVSDAYRIVKDDVTRAEALLRCLAPGVSEATSDADPAFLMEIMELREGLAEAKSSEDNPRVEQLASQVRGSQAETKAEVGHWFQRLSAQGHAGQVIDGQVVDGQVVDGQVVDGQVIDGPGIDKLRAGIGKLKYFRRFLDEVAVVQELFDERQ